MRCLCFLPILLMTISGAFASEDPVWNDYEAKRAALIDKANLSIGRVKAAAARSYEKKQKDLMRDGDLEGALVIKEKLDRLNDPGFLMIDDRGRVEPKAAVAAAVSFNGDTRLRLVDAREMGMRFKERSYEMKIRFTDDADAKIFADGGGANGIALDIIDKKLVLTARAGGDHRLASTEAPLPSLGAWTHLMCFFKKGRLYIFIDGKRQKSRKFPEDFINNHHAEFVLGDSGDWSPSLINGKPGFVGEVEWVRINRESPSKNALFVPDKMTVNDDTIAWFLRSDMVCRNGHDYFVKGQRYHWILHNSD